MTTTADPTEKERRAAIDARFEANDYEGLIEIIDRTGDTKIMWNRRNDDEIAVAKAMFDACIEKGMSIFRVKDKDGSKVGRRLTEFDPSEERLIAVPQTVGG